MIKQNENDLELNINKFNRGGLLMKKQMLCILMISLLSLSATGVLFAQSSGKGKQNEVSLRSQTGTFSKGDIVRMIREKGFHHPYDQSSWQLSPTVKGNVQHEYVQKTEAGKKVVSDRPCLRSHVAAIRIILNKKLGGSA